MHYAGILFKVNHRQTGTSLRGGKQTAAGLTQKVRITAHLAEVIRQELTTVEGFKNPQLGLIQAMNGQ